MDLSRYERALRRIIFELRPYLDEIVIIGGWVPYLYKRYGGFSWWNSNISLTAEVDVLVDRPLPPGERPSIPELLRRADFRPSEEEGGLAVWEGDVQAGEKIEFLVPHEGIGRQAGTVVPVTAQEGMGAIPLEGVEFMRNFKQKLAIPVATDGGEQPLEIWVPTLGAYSVNKASTFSGRREHTGGGNPKRAKDLLYLRDLMAAGPEIVDRIESDLAEMIRRRDTRRRAQERIRYARNTLELALTGALRRILPEVASMLVEREPAFAHETALADIQGHLADLVDVLDESSDRDDPGAGFRTSPL
jgi:hypothetical protein